MDSNPSKKCLQTEDSDIISELPVPILGKILSFLPTKDAVATSILSTRWRGLFPLEVPLTRLDISSSRKSSYVRFVDKLLNVYLRNVACVESVVISCDTDCLEGKMLRWFRAIPRLNVRCLSVRSYSGNSEAMLDIMNGWAALEELELGLGEEGFGLFVPEVFVLPNLKRLSLNQVILGKGMESLLGLLRGCPMLTELRINDYDFGYVETLYIRHPLINKFFMDGTVNDFIGGRRTVVIDAPNLEAFAIKGRFLANYDFVKIKPRHSVCIDYDYLSGKSGRRTNSRRLAKLVQACSSATRLRLAGNSVVELYHFSCVSLPTFANLTCLALGSMGSHGWNILAQFLENAPNLTTLTFEEELDFVYYLANAKTTLESLPYLELNVKKIEIWKFKWVPVEIELLEYLLKNGRLLEKFIVHCLPCENKSDLEKLSMFQRHSKACQVLLKDKISSSEPCYSCESWFQAGHA